jgi:hypothetical protein
MSDELRLPHRVQILGIALRSSLQGLEQGMRQAVHADVPVYNMLETVSHHMRSLGESVSRLSAGVDTLMSDAIAFEAVSDEQVYRAVGRFDAHWEGVVAGLQSILALDTNGADLLARNLLVGVYRHLLNDIRGWLVDLVDTIADPLTGLKKRGLPTTGPIEIPITLKLTPAPQLNSLLQWGQEHGAHLSAAAKQKLGFWQVAGHIGLGFVLWDILSD